MRLRYLEATEITCEVERGGQRMVARAWSGVSDSGVPVTLYVVALQVPDAYITPAFLDEVADLVPVPANGDKPS